MRIYSPSFVFKSAQKNRYLIVLKEIVVQMFV